MMPAMSDLFLPLSGDMNYQSINPLSVFIRAMGSQFGFININAGKSSDPELEQRIFNQVGTYGRQLGAIGDVLRILIKQIKRDELDSTEQQALTALECQLNEIDKLKDRRCGQERTLRDR